MTITKNTETGKRKLAYFTISLLLALASTWLVREAAFTEAQTYVLFLLFFSVCLWLTEAVPPFAVGLFIMAFLSYTLGNEMFISQPEDIQIYINTFSNNVIWLMLGGFFLASAMTKAKLDLDLIKGTLRICGTHPKWILFGLMSVTMFASMLISNTATAAMVVAALLPLLRQLGKKSSAGKALILGIPIAATTGGMGTLIGSPPNAIAAGALAGVGKSIGFTTWIIYGIPVTVILTGLAWWMLVKIFMKNVGPMPARALSPHGPAVNDQASPLQRRTVILILAVTLLLWLTSPFHSLSAAAVSAIPLVFLPLTRILNGEDIRAMGWDTLLLVAGGLSLGTALQQTGLLDLYAERIAGLHVSNLVFFFLLAYATMLFSNIMSNTATSTVLIPLGMAVLPNNQVEVAMIVGLTASTALFLPVSTPPNAIVYSTGLVEQKDFRYGGLLIGLVGPPLIILWVLLIS
jgi:solute carrier family 13 (sodium-dependent dicarboxylate transporter), member 2/3/5